jgi:hypothetical protein
MGTGVKWPKRITDHLQLVLTTGLLSVDWPIDYDGVRLCLIIAPTNGPIVHPPADMWTWRTMVVMMSAADNSWLVHQSSLAVLPAETSGASRGNGRKSENFAYQYLKYLKGSLTCRKILRHGTSGFTSHPKEGVLRIFIALKDPSPRPNLNPRPLDPVASTLTTTSSRRLYCQLLGRIALTFAARNQAEVWRQ